jgi:hypothetical protein
MKWSPSAVEKRAGIGSGLRVIMDWSPSLAMEKRAGIEVD